MTTLEFYMFAEQKKWPNGDRYTCEECSPKSEDINGVSTANSGTKRKKTEDPIDEINKQWTLNDIMVKLIEMDKRYQQLVTKYDQQIQINNELQYEVKDLKKAT